MILGQRTNKTEKATHFCELKRNQALLKPMCAILLLNQTSPKLKHQNIEIGESETLLV